MSILFCGLFKEVDREKKINSISVYGKDAFNKHATCFENFSHKKTEIKRYKKTGMNTAVSDPAA